MLFSSRRLWYYITLSLHHFQRLPFLTIELSSMQRTSRACFWTRLTLLLWSHIHSHTHLFAFSNLAISCGRPALSICVSVLIYASHLPDAVSPESFPLSQAHLHGSPVAPRWQAGCPATLPSSSSDSGGGSPPCSFFIQLSCSVLFSWVDSFSYGFTRSGGFLTVLCGCGWAQPSGHEALPSAFPQDMGCAVTDSATGLPL